MLGPANRKNAFLSELSPAEYAALRGYLAPMDLRVGQYLHYLGDAVDEVILPHSGLIATTMPLRAKPGAAAALIGRDGILGGLAVLADAPAASEAVVHIAGHASRLPAAAFRQLLDQNPSLVHRVVRYAQALLAQTQQNAVCHAMHPVEARICRWLIAIQACCGGHRVPLFQGALAQMLGVRRTSVTMIVGRLEQDGLIKCHRGYMDIIDQNKLEQCSCECHATLDGYLTDLLSAPADTAPPAEVSHVERPLVRRAF